MGLLAFIGAIVAVLGALFLLLAALGLVRMPDLYSRMQAGTKATTLGTILIAVGVGFVVPSMWAKLLLLAVFVFLTNPVSSHALSRSAHHQGVDPLAIRIRGRTLTGTDALAATPSPTGEGAE